MRIASVGFWHLHGTDYAEEALGRDDVDLVAAWDPDPSRAESAAGRLGVPTVPDLETILDDGSIEGVIVCTATVDHVEVVTRCLRAGKHVFMEKVLASTLEEARVIVAVAREQDAALTVSLWRSDKGYAGQIATMVAAGAVGRVTSVRIRDGHPFAVPTADRPDGVLPAQFYDPAAAEGGALIDLCHPLYLTARILGYPVAVSSAFGFVTRHPVEDNAAVLLAYPDGAIAVAETSYVSRFTPFSIEVHGTEGSILFSEPGIGALVAERDHGPIAADGPDDLPRLRWRSTAHPRRGWVEVEVERDAPLAFDQWLTHCRTGTRGDANLDLALALSGIVEAAYGSARHGRTEATPAL